MPNFKLFGPKLRPGEGVGGRGYMVCTVAKQERMAVGEKLGAGDQKCGQGGGGEEEGVTELPKVEGVMWSEGICRNIYAKFQVDRTKTETWREVRTIAKKGHMAFEAKLGAGDQEYSQGGGGEEVWLSCQKRKVWNVKYLSKGKWQLKQRKKQEGKDAVRDEEEGLSKSPYAP
ncbi:hypothetical protein CPC08DRAFT_730418 [Agrocybe pediades]|nr:hypothetical protein CPC08DRAFT_730418 [Agrocybe pediades]